MPIADVIRFFAARGVPAALGFLALVVFTRVLSPEQFGVYSVTLSGANVISAAAFSWLALSAVRFGVDGVPERGHYLAAILQLYVVCIIVIVIAFCAFAALSGGVGSTVLAAGGLVLTESWFQLNQKLAIARVQARRFAIMASTKVFVGLVVGSLAAVAGFGATGVMTGVMLGSLAAGFAPRLYGEWNLAGLRTISRTYVIDVLRYGGPLGVTVALGYLLGTGDRLLLTVNQGAGSAGQYAAGYDLAYSTLTLVLTTVNMVVYPHVLNAADSSDAIDRRRRFKGSLDLLLVVSLPALIGLVAFAPNVTDIVLGTQFSEAAALVVPWVACATFIGGVRSYFLDITFHLERDTRAILSIVAVVVSVNLVVNVLLIDSWGMRGALAAIVIAQCVGFWISAVLGYRRRNRAPAPDLETGKIVVAACAAGLVAWLASDLHGAGWLCVQIVVVATTYCLALAILRAAVFSDFVSHLAHRFSAPTSGLRLP